MNNSGIYRLFCTVSGKSYVGQSVDVVRRVEGHFRYLHEGRHYNKHLQYSFNLHGHGAFLAEVLEYCDRNVLTEREQYWIDYYGFEKLYNICSAAGSTAGLKFSDEARQNMSKARKGKKRKPFSDEHKANLSKAKVGNQYAKGLKRSDEYRAKLSESKKGKPGKAGHVFSEESKAKMREAARKRWNRYC